MNDDPSDQSMQKDVAMKRTLKDRRPGAATTSPGKSLVVGGAGLGLILFSLYLFTGSVQLLDAGRVASSLLSALIGFATLSGGVALIRSWAASKVVEDG